MTASREHSALETASVLIVDNEPPVRTLTRTILERAGYRVRTRPRADAEALCDREAGGIDLLVTDITCVGRQRPALFTRLREKRPSLRVLPCQARTRRSSIGIRST